MPGLGLTPSVKVSTPLATVALVALPLSCSEEKPLTWLTGAKERAPPLSSTPPVPRAFWLAATNVPCCTVVPPV